jgi:hypothetical protein
MSKEICNRCEQIKKLRGEIQKTLDNPLEPEIFKMLVKFQKKIDKIMGISK